MGISFFNRKAARADAAMLPLVTSLPVRRRKPAPQADEVAATDAAALPPAQPAGPQVAPAEDDILFSVVAQLNTTGTDSASAPVLPPAPPPADPSPPIEVHAVAEASPAESTPPVDTVAADHANVDDDALHLVLSAAFGEALAPTGPSGPAEPAMEDVPPTAIPQTDAELIGILRAADAAVADTRSDLPTPRRRLKLPWIGSRVTDRSAGVRTPRAAMRIPGNRAQQWLTVAAILPLPLVLLASLVGPTASFAAMLVTFAVSALQSDLRQLSQPAAAGKRPLPLLLPLPPQTLRAVPATTFLALVGGLHVLTGGVTISAWTWVFTTLALAVWLAQVPARAALDLSARRAVSDRRRGRLVLAMLLLPHRPAVQRLIHNRLAATADDPMTADAGESVYAFALRAVPGAIVTGFEMERTLMRPRLGAPRGLLHPHLTIGLTTAAFVALAVVAFGPLALPMMLILAILTEAQLLVAEYVRHFGLLRRTGQDGQVDPLSDLHTWRAPLAFGSLLPHLAGTPPPGAAPADAPVLPHSFPVMALRALVPSAWHGDLDARVMALAKRSSQAL